MYDLLRKGLFLLSPETAHEASLELLGAAARLNLTGWIGKKVAPKPVRVMGIDFPNPVGLAAGMDKNGEFIDGLAALGFGFIEVGTVTPRPQPGNPKPRLFRLPEAEAIINRMGFNNQGIDQLIANVRQSRFNGVLGINIGKNKDTPSEQAADDYLTCLRKAYPYASYITINISSPNTPGLRDLQFGDQLSSLLAALKEEQLHLHQQIGKYVPLAVKIAPDMDEAGIEQIAESLIKNSIDGVIATNTTVSREGVKHLQHGQEQGGLSGLPVLDMATETQRLMVQALDGRLPVMGVGGILNGEHASEKILAGAELVQLYTGFIYRGPKLITECVEAIRDI
ncbi:quinone-dependent dihydroorotate dehydrogenase [Gynuella sunshinyii]|uniref:Dihydroorotate dehydrogenase (quinone) n=1 Tax=Gynuella sunshinyii YC6258 TaxID=1445510 RepID=A0A0C5VL55_9GAMM|nr:quinone-dependent dihydroorotate dehydrogenase [Gynuella sunshinyii]AJQ95432.1 dihydroorotate dehydrogenase [Gynuella sunshinyii YC6258]